MRRHSEKCHMLKGPLRSTDLMGPATLTRQAYIIMLQCLTKGHMHVMHMEATIQTVLGHIAVLKHAPLQAGASILRSALATPPELLPLPRAAVPHLLRVGALGAQRNTTSNVEDLAGSRRDLHVSAAGLWSHKGDAQRAPAAFYLVLQAVAAGAGRSSVARRLPSAERQRLCTAPFVLSLESCSCFSCQPSSSTRFRDIVVSKQATRVCAYGALDQPNTGRARVTTGAVVRDTRPAGDGAVHCSAIGNLEQVCQASRWCVCCNAWALCLQVYYSSCQRVPHGASHPRCCTHRSRSLTSQDAAQRARTCPHHLAL